jgi:hypothetical protein
MEKEKKWWCEKEGKIHRGFWKENMRKIPIARTVLR